MLSATRRLGGIKNSSGAHDCMLDETIDVKMQALENLSRSHS